MSKMCVEAVLVNGNRVFFQGEGSYLEIKAKATLVDKISAFGHRFDLKIVRANRDDYTDLNRRLDKHSVINI